MIGSRCQLRKGVFGPSDTLEFGYDKFPGNVYARWVPPQEVVGYKTETEAAAASQLVVLYDRNASTGEREAAKSGGYCYCHARPCGLQIMQSPA